MKLYLSGPMSFIPQFNFPAFFAAAEHLRSLGHEVINPAEADGPEIYAIAMASENGDPAVLPPGATWGELLARDVKIISDDVKAIVFLKDWQTSRGAKLEAFTGLLQKEFTFALYNKDAPDSLVKVPPIWVKNAVFENLKVAHR